MQKRIQCIAIILSLSSLKALPLPEIQVFISTPQGKEVFTLQVARELSALKTGLSGQTYLDTNRGMLFDFSSSRRVAMWMKDAVIALDILFLDAQWTILAIYPNARPGSSAPIAPQVRSRYVIELKAGTARRLGLRRGAKITTSDLFLGTLANVGSVSVEHQAEG